MSELESWWESISENVRAALVLTLVGIIAISGFLLIRLNTQKTTLATSQPTQSPAVVNPTYSASDIIAEINAIRATKGLAALTESSSLDAAALARSNEMVSQNIRDNSTGDTSALITNAGYSANGWNLQSTWANATAKDTAASLTNNQAFALDSTYSNIGVGVSSYDNNAQKLVAVFLSSPKPAQTYSSYQTYWYCWNSGNPAPHHLGYHVSGDHYCSYQELHDAGFAGY